MNILNNLMNGLGNVQTASTASSSFRPGQIVNGQIIKFFPNNIASLQVGSQKIIAQLETSLDVGPRYWFQVQSGEGKVKLKVIGPVVSGNVDGIERSLNNILKEFSISASRENLDTLRFFLKEQLPVNHENIQKATQWVKESKSLQVGEEAIKLMQQKELPMTKATFQAIYTVLENEPLSDSIEALQSQLQKNSSSENGNQLSPFLQSIREKQDELRFFLQVQLPTDPQDITNEAILKTAGQTTSWSESSLLVDFLKESIKSIGFSYENNLANHLNPTQHGQNLKLETLKSLLVDFLQGNPSDITREIAEKMLNKITGLQLLGQESGPVQQYVFQIPIPLQNKSTDLTIQWNGRKTKNGEIDPSFCRILFYLELESLHDTMIDMQVQNRVVSITVTNENENIRRYASPLIKPLKEKLAMLDYTLSSIHFTHLSEKKNEPQRQKNYLRPGSYSGVDLRI